MKRFVLIASILCACAIAHAQSIEKAKASYQQFTLLRTSETSSDRLYSALHQCCKDYQAVLNNPATSTYDQMEAKSTLKELYPHLQNAAAYYSNRRGGMSNAILFAQAFVDIPLLPAFKADTYMRDEQYANMVYFVAANTYNAHDYKRAVKYLRLYIDLGISSRQQDVYKSLSQAYLNLREYDFAMATMEEYLHIFPQDFTILSMMINLCIERQDNTNLQKYVTQALAIQPNNKTLLNIQGKLYEDTFEFQKALGVYNQMLKENPNSLNINQHVALNCYNLGVMDYNRASMAEDEATAKRLDYQSKEYFAAAATTLRVIVENDPTDVKYVQALATAYSCLGNETQLNNMNMKLRQMGRNEVARDVMPTLISHSGKTSSPSDMGRPTSGQNYGYGPSQNAPSMQSGSVSDELPLYSVFAKEYVETRLRKWQEKDPYETIDEYTTRVNESTRNAKVEELKKEAEAKYIADCTKKISFYDMKLKPYDAENSVFLVESPYGELIVPVPRERNEARIFENSWNGIEFKNPEFYINNDKLMLASLTFVTPTGNSYRFDVDKGLGYTETVVDIDFDPITNDAFIQNQSHGNIGSRVKKNTVKMGTSDVDINIPEASTINPKTFAVIISNENYGMVAPVPMALNDGKTFSEYCKKTLGLPEKNVELYPDASYGVMLRAINKIKNIAEAYSGDINVIFYYAGHGIPNESTKDAFLLPIDADGKQTDGCYSLNRLYSELGALNARSVVVFLDACFSGAARNDKDEMLASARGVALTPKKEAPKGNMVIFSAASNDETAFPYLEKGHGLFTYFLLKKLQETKGNVTLQALSEYIISNVKQLSVIENEKPQTPSVSSSGSLLDGWQGLQLNGQQ